ncbi:MAG: hypothetical protein H6R10_3618 [Rhodocyclaceae bacterium]|nr:hypothetical protein [Rhodocyclaceae bacterium]
MVDDAGDLVTEALNEGTDLVQSSITYTLTSNVENLTLTGTAAIDGTGNTLANVITGNAGDNVLDGGAGADTLVGGAGNDTYRVDNTSDVITEAAGGGTDSVFASATYTLSANVENLTLTGTANINGTGNALDNVILGNSGANTLNGDAGNDTLDGGAGADAMNGGIGDDTYIVDNAGDLITEALNAGTDTVRSGISYTLTANVENLVLTGAGNLNGTGNALNNAITGTGGNNTLDGGAGVDTMIGGAGDDTYVVDNTGDGVAELANEGTDTVLASASYTLSANIENLTLTGTASINGTGNELDNVLVGNSGNNVLSGLAGNDTLTGNAGNDTLDGGTGADAMAGGAGNDTYVVDSADDLVVELAGEGTDTVQASFAYTLGANLENLTLTGADVLAGTGNEAANVLVGNAGDNALYGVAGNDTLVGNAGNDTLDGGTGADAMAGGTGDDLYLVDNAGDAITELAGEGNDTVESSVSYTLSANVENLVLTGAGNLDGTGNALDNAITGTTGNNVLDGGSGADTLAGGAGDDTYVVDNSADVVVENASEGNDTVLASATYTLSDNVENLTLTGSGDINATGNALDNVLTGNAGINMLAGGAGNDTYVVNNSADGVVENAGEGIDTVRASASYTLSANVENLVLTGSGNLSGTGNDLDNSITGTSGDNVLDGGAGADTLVGGLGNDTYVVDHAGDQVVENPGEGTDTVMASVSYTLGDALENLTLTGNAAISGTGNAQANLLTGSDADNVLAGLAGNDTLVGNAGNDLLDGGEGADQMAGGSGDDTYVVDQAGDQVVELVGEGSDTVQSSITYTLGSTVENLELTGSADLSGTGNALDNRLVGNAGNNVLTGGDGNDTLAGGAGSDRLFGGAGDDRYVFQAGDGSDRILDNQGADTLFVGGGLTEANLEAERIGDDIAIHILGTNDFITLDNWYNQLEGVKRIEFGDGSSLDRTGIDELRNRPPVANADLITAQEDGGAVTVPTSFLLANDTDPNPGDVLSVVAVGTSQVGAAVSLADGQVTYDIGNAFQELAEGEVLKDSFTYTITDSKGAPASSLVEVSIVGVNDAPVLSSDAGATVEDSAGLLTGNVLANDYDVDHGTVLAVAAPGDYEGFFGTLSLAADGSYAYQLNNAWSSVQSLAEGQVATEHFDYAVTDGIASVAAALDFTVTGVNDAPVVAGDSGQVTEDGILEASGNVLANDTDVDAGTVLAVAAPGEYAGSYGSLSVAADGSYTYRLDNGSLAVQSLAQGTTVVDRFEYAATDGLVAVNSALAIAVGGVNDAPVTEADSAYATEDLQPAVTGNVLANDHDVDAGTVLQVEAPGSYAGDYGSLSLAADGSYAYALDNASLKVQSLGRTAQRVEHFGYVATDGLVGTAEMLDVFLQGTNDAPIVVTPLADQQVNFHKPFFWALPAGSFADIDAGDTLDYTATLADGSALPDWLHFDAQKLTFSGVAPKAEMDLDVRVTATDRVAATGSTEGSLSVSDVFVLEVSHGNEGVGNGEDAAPSGHDANQNDGPGTAPGQPGHKGAKATGDAAPAVSAPATATPSASHASDSGTTSKETKGRTAATPTATARSGSDDLSAWLAVIDPVAPAAASAGTSSALSPAASSASSSSVTSTLLQWSQVDTALAKHLAKSDGASLGSQPLAQPAAVSPYLATASDPLAGLSGNSNLERLKGLKEGFKKVA